METKHKQH